MSNFLGSEICVLDAKGRLNVPSRMRRGLAPEAHDTFVIVRGFDPCVNMYPVDEWARFSDELRALKRGNDDARAFISMLFDTAHEASVDSQGRISLTDRLIEIAGLDKEAKLLGVMDHIQIWNPKRWAAKYGAIDTKEVDALAKRFLS